MNESTQSALAVPTLAELASALISVFEGPVHLMAFKPTPADPWTIGRGHTKGVVEGQTCTMQQSDQWLAEDQAPLFEMVDGITSIRAVGYVSFGYNCGQGALHKVLSGNDTIDNPVHTMNRAGQVLGGLVSRRRLESLLTRL